MRIGINCHSFLNKQYAGIGRYAYNLVLSLSTMDKENAYFLYGRKKPFEFRKSIPIFPSNNFIPKLDLFDRGIEKTLDPIDIYHSPSPGPFDIRGARRIVTIHDLIYKAFPQGHTEETVATTDCQMQDIVQKAYKIICCSQNTCNDLHRYFDVNHEKTCVIFQGVDKKCFYPLSDEERMVAESYLRSEKIDTPFILFAGTIEPRKNLENLIRAFALLKQKKNFEGPLVVVGKKGWKSENIPDLIKQCRLENDVIFLGYIPDGKLGFLYNMAEVFVFPSFYEGFGFPILEAFCCGAAVVTSFCSSCPEVARDAALLIDPNNPQDIARAVSNILDNKELKDMLRAKALKRAQDFSFEKTAKETLALYKEVHEG